MIPALVCAALIAAAIVGVYARFGLFWSFVSLFPIALICEQLFAK